MAVEKGAQEVISASGTRTAAYTLTKAELKVLFEAHGFNTRGVGWLNMIDRWRICGEFVPPEKTLKTEDDWWVAFLRLTATEKLYLESFALHNEIGQVMA